MKNKLLRFIDRPFLSWLIVSVITYITVEIISQRSFVGFLKFTFLSPHVFLLNLGIVMLTYSFVLFFRRKLFIYSVVGLLWLVVDVVNVILLIQRNTHFNASDIPVFRYGVFITMRYFNAFHVVLLILLICIAIVGIVLLYKRAHRFEGKIDYRKSAIITVSTLLATVLLSTIGFLSNSLDTRFIDIPYGYNKNGFVFAFGCSIFEQGVEEPDNFSNDLIEKISGRLDSETTSAKRPNIIFVQLESFIEPDEIIGLKYDTNPTPNFSKLMQDYPSGYLTVPVMGGGTANVEFEVMTGMNLKDFGTVEYPYESILDERTCESMAFNLKNLGYNTHAVHNFSAGFYQRNIAFSNLGFDTFTSFEYMSDIEYNDIGWAKDTILERYITSALKSTQGSDYVYAISVQGHGTYPSDFTDSAGDINTTYSSKDISEFESELNYYVSQICEMDKLIGNLTKRFADYEEDTVIVFYGDHLPGINFNQEMLKSGSLYKTEYVIWSNFDINANDRDLNTYQLSAYVQKILGFSEGKITQFHQKYSDMPEYTEYLQAIEYDIIEGDSVIYGGKNPFVATTIKYGVEEIIINSIEYRNKKLYVFGENFNEQSTVYIGDSRKKTEYVNSKELVVENVNLEKGDTISVAQMSYQMPWTYLTKCKEFTFKN